MSGTTTQSSLVRIRMTSSPGMYGAPDPRGGEGRVDLGDELVLDMGDPQQRAWAQEHGEGWPSKGWFEVLEGEIPPAEGDIIGRIAEPEPEPAAAAVDPAIAVLARKGTRALQEEITKVTTSPDGPRKAHAAAVEARKKRGEELREAEAAAELDGKDRGAIAKAEAKLSEAERDERAKKAALDVATERAAAQLSRLEPALALAERSEADAALEVLFAKHETALATYVEAMIALANARLAAIQTLNEYDGAGQLSGRPAWIPDVGIEREIRFYRDAFADKGFDIRQDQRGRWTVRRPDAR